MRSLYVTFQAQYVVSELMTGDIGAVRAPFQVLLDSDVLDRLVLAGATNYDHFYNAERDNAVPFIPSLGSLRLRAKAQVEHRAFGHSYGYPQLPGYAHASSPTGLRLLPRTVELTSEHRLVDTYESDRNLDLSRRITNEGTTDYLVSVDQSVWHVALSVEPRRRITVEPQDQWTEELLRDLQVSTRVYVHVYPHGGLTVTLGMGLVFDPNIEIDRILTLLKRCLDRQNPGITLALGRVVQGSVHHFVRDIAGMTIGAIAPESRVPEYVHLDLSLSAGADEGTLSDAQLIGLLTLDPRYRNFRPSWLQARASLYGKYGGDRVVATRSSLAVATSPRNFSPSGRRRFFWRCHAIKELAVVQSLVIGRVAGRLAKVGTGAGPGEEETSRLLMIGEHLAEFPRGLPAHHRKWFYECQRLVQGGSTLDSFYRALAVLHEDARHAAIMRTMDDNVGVRITLSHSQVGTLNLGTIVGDVQTHLSSISGPNAEEARDALRRLAQAVIDEHDLSDTTRVEALQSIDFLAEEAGKDAERRRAAAIRPVLTSLATTLSAAGGLAEVWGVAGPVVLGFFGLAT